MMNGNHNGNGTRPKAKNVLGGELKVCCKNPMTGFFRTGKCETGTEDRGAHLICAEMTDDFLEFSRAHGNDLITPRPEFEFPGLKAGDCWCLCATRWTEALAAGCAPRVKLDATHEAMLHYASLEDLQHHAAE